MKTEVPTVLESDRLFYRDLHTWIFNGDCRSMYELPDECVQAVCCSPPYWGLRKYSGEQELIWGPADCNHQWQADNTKHDNLRFRGKDSIVGNERNRDIHPVGSWKETDCEHEWDIETPARRNRGVLDIVDPESKQATISSSAYDAPSGAMCSKCGAWRGAFGLEPTPEMYVDHSIEILREIRRVVRPDGVVFWVIGDSYWGGKGRSGGADAEYQASRHSLGVSLNTSHQQMTGKGKTRPADGSHLFLKPKDLCMIPSRVADAAQQDGWWLRSMIVWKKENPMPESVGGWRWERHKVKVKGRGKSLGGIDKQERLGQGNPHAARDGYEATWQDCLGCPQCEKNGGYVLRKGSWRPTESHEYILMLTKSENYYGDIEAVREPLQDSTLPRMLRGVSEDNKWVGGAPGQSKQALGQPRPNVKYIDKEEYGGGGSSFIGHSGYTKADGTSLMNPNGRNLRSVWDMTTQPFSGWEYDWDAADFVGSDGKPYIASEDCVLHKHLYQWQEKQAETNNGQPNRDYPDVSDIRDYKWVEVEEGRRIEGRETEQAIDSAQASLLATIPEHDFAIERKPLARADGEHRCLCKVSHGSHFAVFPEKIPETCIKAVTPEVGSCAKCGASWARVIERQNLSTYEEIKRETGKDYHDSIKLTEPRGVALSGGQKSVGNTLTPDGKVPWYNKPDNKTIGWKPTCDCGVEDTVPALVLDPFMGRGTTLWVAKKLGRQAVGYDISREYCNLAVKSNMQQILDLRG